LHRTGLEASAQVQAGLLPHGHKRQLEIAMCLAGRPQVLLLDEPLAGMGAEETERMLSLLQSLKSEHAILLVEHDNDAVFGIADCISVMVNGAAIACGTPPQIRANPQVQQAYLGDEACTHFSMPAACTATMGPATCCAASTCASPPANRWAWS